MESFEVFKTAFDHSWNFVFGRTSEVFFAAADPCQHLRHGAPVCAAAQRCAAAFGCA